MMETKWLKEALFAGQTANAFKLGTVLTLGWFWPRVSGCCLLYRGCGMETIEFGNILVVDDFDASQVQPPSYVQHNSDTTYFYVIRRANSCGDEEHTLSAAVKVSLTADGELVPAQPNEIFGAAARQLAGSRIQLVWFYYPLGQRARPAYFKVYYDDGTGQIDYENPIVVMNYSGRGFYRYQSEELDEDRYMFAIRTEDASGTEKKSFSQKTIQLDLTEPNAISILAVEAV
ncbi:MAG: hypothetical protein ACYS8Y_02665 [Planctomycetota bacterium]